MRGGKRPKERSVMKRRTMYILRLYNWLWFYSHIPSITGEQLSHYQFISYSRFYLRDFYTAITALFMAPGRLS